LSLLAGKDHHRNITICEWSSFSSCIKNVILMSNVHLILFRLYLIIVACFAITAGFRFRPASKKLLKLLSPFCLNDPWNTGRTFVVVSHFTLCIQRQHLIVKTVEERIVRIDDSCILKTDDDSFASKIPVGRIFLFLYLLGVKKEFGKRVLEWEYANDQNNLGTLCIVC
jgi:hypothetical protein